MATLNSSLSGSGGHFTLSSSGLNKYGKYLTPTPTNSNFYYTLNGYLNYTWTSLNASTYRLTITGAGVTIVPPSLSSFKGTSGTVLSVISSEDTGKSCVLTANPILTFNGTTISSTGISTSGKQVIYTSTMEIASGSVPKYKTNASGSNAAYSLSATTIDVSLTHASQSLVLAFTPPVKWGNLSSAAGSNQITLTAPAKASYSVTYNANGGTGAPAAQTKWYGETLKLQTGTPTRTGYRFKGWSTTSTGSVNYDAGANYTGNAALTLYAVWQASYTITYNANGGTGAPAAQTKWAGENLTLSTTVPTRTKYKFLGWSTSSTANTVNYAPGATFSTDKATVLYAVWQLQYDCAVTSLKVLRCDQNGSADDAGEYMMMSADVWTSGALNFYVKVKATYNDGTTSAVFYETQFMHNVTDTFTQSLIYNSGSEDLVFSTDSSYTITLTVQLLAFDDSGTVYFTTSRNTVLTQAQFILDFAPTGKGMGIGTTSPDEGLALGWDTFPNVAWGSNLGSTTKPFNNVIAKSLYAGYPGITENYAGLGQASLSFKRTDSSKISVWMSTVGIGDSVGKRFEIDLYDDAASAYLNVFRLLPTQTTFSKPVTVSSGGTGATTAANARTNLGITTGYGSNYYWVIVGNIMVLAQEVVPTSNNATFTYTFAKAFAAAPYITGSVATAGAQSIFNFNAVTATNFQCWLARQAGNVGKNMPTHIIAVGRV